MDDLVDFDYFHDDPLDYEEEFLYGVDDYDHLDYEEDFLLGVDDYDPFNYEEDFLLGVDDYDPFDFHDDFPDGVYESSYPNDWFTKNRGKKPTINVLYSRDQADLRSSLVHSLYAELRMNKINIEHAITFLYIYARDSMRETLAEDWKSYSVSIGMQGSTITPLNIIDVQLKNSKFEDLKETKAQLPPKDDWLAFYLCTFYRLGKIDFKQKQYRKKIVNDAMKRIQQICGNNNAIKALHFHETNSNSNNYNYRGLIAAYDMFLHKFQKNSAAFCRFGTSESRLRDCAAMSTYLFACKFLGLKTEELVKWFVTSQLQNESKALLSPKEEYSNEFSYFMYQMDFQLTMKSAYSVSRNRFTYFLCNSVLAILLNERGLRAKQLIDESSARGLIDNAKIIAYIFRPQTTHGKLNDPNEPKGRDAKEWTRFMEPKCWKPTQTMTKWFEGQRALLTRTNPGTVGEFLRKN